MDAGQLDSTRNLVTEPLSMLLCLQVDGHKPESNKVMEARAKN